jgi:hypothetical protein
MGFALFPASLPEGCEAFPKGALPFKAFPFLVATLHVTGLRRSPRSYSLASLFRALRLGLVLPPCRAGLPFTRPQGFVQPESPLHFFGVATVVVLDALLGLLLQLSPAPLGKPSVAFVC